MMNDLTLTEQLRALRQPPPDNGFEARLEQALAQEAQALRAPGVVIPFRSAQRLRRWGGRVGLGMALALGATAAAAAAGGIWALVVTRAEPVLPPAATPAAEHVTAPRAAARGTPPIVPPEPAPAFAEPQSAPLPALPMLPAVAAPRADRHQAIRHAVPARAERAGAAVEAPRQEPEELAPFELPTAPKGAAAPTSSASPESVGSERRALPELPARPERPRGGPAHAQRDKTKERKGKDKAWPPGREIARERSGLDRAERGLERAGEARGRKE